MSQAVDTAPTLNPNISDGIEYTCSALIKAYGYEHKPRLRNLVHVAQTDFGTF